MKVRLGKKDALIIVDVQKDFCPGGALPVPQGNKVVEPLNRYIHLFSRHGSLVLPQEIGILRITVLLRNMVVYGPNIVFRILKVLNFMMI